MKEPLTDTFDSSGHDTVTSPLVGIIMGSDSDLPVMKGAIEILDSFGVSHEVNIVSAHRTPEWLYEYTRSAQGRGLKVLIAGAGGSAHLPGMAAALTSLPVIGIPVSTKSAAGIDSLFSIVQMPPGVPVATVAINGAKNAGILAAQMIATSDVSLYEKIVAFKTNLEKEVLEKAQKLQEKGFEQYIKENLS